MREPPAVRWNVENATAATGSRAPDPGLPSRTAATEGPGPGPRRIRGGRRGPRRWLLALLAVALLAATGTPGAFPAGPGTIGAPISSPAGAGGGTGGLTAAIASLDNGSGPAGGVPMHCVRTGSEAQCGLQNPATGPVPASLATPGPPVATGLHVGSPAAPGALAVPGGGPSPRVGASLALFLNGTRFDVLLFGGAATDGGTLVPGYPSDNTSVYGDTWQFDVGDHTWWNVTPYLACSAARCPGPRWGAAMTYDYGDGYTLLFGGCANGSLTMLANNSCPGPYELLSDTWSYQDPSGGVGRWTAISSFASPTARFEASMAYDGSDQEVILFGGCALRSCPAGDTWAFRSGRWQQVYTPPGPAFNPPRRFGASMAQLGTSGGVVLFGGCQNSVVDCDHGARLLGDTWLFYDGSWWEYFNAVNCSAHYPCPSPRYDAALTSYSGGGLAEAALMFGGIGANGTVLGNATEPGAGWWVFGGSPLHWMPFTAPPGWGSPQDGWDGPAVPGAITGAFGAVTAPVPRYDAGLVGTPYGGVVLFGGTSTIGSPLGDTWAANPLSAPPEEFPYSGLIGPQSFPPPEYGAASAYDASDNATLLFSGCGFSCGNRSTWTFDPYSPATRSEAWQVAVPPAGTPYPPERFGASLTATTLDHGSVLLFGGQNSSGGYLNDLWQYSHGRWQQLRPEGAVPSPRSSAAMAFNASSGEVVLFGGFGPVGLLGDTWTLQYLAAVSDWVWTEVGTRHAPTPRDGASFAYDSTAGKLVLFGGCSFEICPMADTWTFGGGQWTACSSLSCRTEGPPARQEAAFSDDPELGGLLLFGGCGRPCPLADTWRFNATGGGVWTELRTTAAPPAVYLATMSYNPGLQAPVLWGGIGTSNALEGGMGWAFRSGGWQPLPSTALQPPPTAPLPEFGASLVDNPVDRYVLLFGGCGGTFLPGACNLGTSAATTWIFAGGLWKEVCGADCGPSPRWDPILFFDAPSGDGILLWGGCPDNAANNGACTDPLNDTWEFKGTGWSNVTISGGPPARADAAVASEFPFANITLVYGGWNGSGALGDAWSFFNGSWSQDTMPKIGPPASFGGRMVFDPLSATYLLYGGMAPAAGGVQDALWALPAIPPPPPVAPSGISIQLGWSELSPGPRAVFDPAASFDTGLDEMVVYGGVGGSGQPVDELQIYHPASGTWSGPVAGPAPLGARSGADMVFDPFAGPDGADLLFGGLISPSPAGYSGLSGAIPGGISGFGQGDLWSYTNSGWTDVSVVA